eukprot:1161305-Pelagomonas_calceolata.AAC.6
MHMPASDVPTAGVWGFVGCKHSVCALVWSLAYKMPAKHLAGWEQVKHLSVLHVPLLRTHSKPCYKEVQTCFLIASHILTHTGTSSGSIHTQLIQDAV